MSKDRYQVSMTTTGTDDGFTYSEVRWVSPGHTLSNETNTFKKQIYLLTRGRRRYAPIRSTTS